MNWNAISAIADAIGAVAVVVTLAYLAVQIRQNTRAIRGSTLDSITAHQQNELRWSSDVGHAFRKSLDNPNLLNEEETWLMSEWMTAALIARHNEFCQYTQGLLGEDGWKTSENIIRYVLSSEWAQRWWKIYGRNHFSEPFVCRVDEIIEEGTLDYSGALEEIHVRSTKNDSDSR